MERWNRAVAGAAALLLTVGARRVAAQDPATPDQGGTAAVGTELWYTQPWVWIVLGIVLLAVILALTTRRGRTRT